MSDRTLIEELDAEILRLRTELNYLEGFRGRLSPNGHESRHPELVDRDPDAGPVVMVPRSRGRKQRDRPEGGRQLGSREQEVMDTLRHNPDGLTIPELAAAMDSSEKYLYRALPRLMARGLVRTDSLPAGTELGEDRSRLGHSPRWFAAAAK